MQHSPAFKGKRTSEMNWIKFHGPRNEKQNKQTSRSIETSSCALSSSSSFTRNEERSILLSPETVRSAMHAN
jgi:hypothetical protein